MFPETDSPDPKLAKFFHYNYTVSTTGTLHTDQLNKINSLLYKNLVESTMCCRGFPTFLLLYVSTALLLPLGQ